MLDATTTNTSPPCTGNQHLAACIPITIASFQPATSQASCQRYYIVLFPSDRIHTEFETIRSVMLRNGYPVELIDRGITSFLSRLHKPRQNQQEDDKQEPVIIVVPFLGRYTRLLEKKIKQSLR